MTEWTIVQGYGGHAPKRGCCHLSSGTECFAHCSPIQATGERCIIQLHSEERLKEAEHSLNFSSHCSPKRHLGAQVYVALQKEAEESGLPLPGLEAAFTYELCAGIVDKSSSLQQIAADEVHWSLCCRLAEAWSSGYLAAW